MSCNKIFLLSGVLIFLSGCTLWPYKSDFDCPRPKGEHCKPLYEINKLADLCIYAPKVDELALCDGPLCKRSK